MMPGDAGMPLIILFCGQTSRASRGIRNVPQNDGKKGLKWRPLPVTASGPAACTLISVPWGAVQGQDVQNAPGISFGPIFFQQYISLETVLAKAAIFAAARACRPKRFDTGNFGFTIFVHGRGVRTRILHFLTMT